MSNSLPIRLLMILALLFAQQAGAMHALHHALEDLTQQQEEGKQAPHSDNCQKCADYMQLGSALGAGAFDFTPPLAFSEPIQHRNAVFRSIPVLSAEARGPPFFLQSFA